MKSPGWKARECWGNIGGGEEKREGRKTKRGRRKWEERSEVVVRQGVGREVGGKDELGGKDEVWVVGVEVEVREESVGKREAIKKGAGTQEWKGMRERARDRVLGKGGESQEGRGKEGDREGKGV
ncbi:hypothetical protein Pmani_034865 [Petrolisthes manimaculis]|uniref:Uncharacterized protein n=1 Tax=Petrolisthes manimaculis TaxID=1843537 RepID=A0AAE1TR42_9EUCA|nr:hypothetical protein Pmani_034865 [Petrolisthes manimaculis]